MTDFQQVASRLIRAIEDWPEDGVTFRDITPLLADPAGLAATVEALVDAARALGPIDVVAGVEARGFLLAPLIAEALGTGLVPVRKAGKLPAARLTEAYALEYAEAVIEIHADAVTEGARVLIVDDVLATGGTLAAAVRLFERAGAEVAGALVLIELPALGGRDVLAGVPLTALLEY
ncbi:adenine phosphoribosyltransferase [Aeromicrobium sp. 636]|uniref:Adenine phosphoribosyltransferase n=1 Tax=Aeromicrobium senzhongii TaxID=2663859 RepID=A0A8I0K008_9ACTN|nr:MULTISPECIES: adenine phosphoribosyltransferase [Aeromicrobium]MBC9225293.1 adenine phosphoribosyltransferase [Aeromicrobium senzhongii]MCQ3997403.1 adenine phosphoribosyltransferase [Aeromicrobium sp. 636]MTB87336.1 adenine phosphoribosyltransferase [Aeromicrobium senzhongii]QNL95601.1 adenine phosphoribosyltransferase [Aeromicrobium senzhongii]